MVHTVLMAASTIGVGRKNRTRLNQAGVVVDKSDKNTVVLGRQPNEPDDADAAAVKAARATKSSS